MYVCFVSCFLCSSASPQETTRSLFMCVYRERRSARCRGGGRRRLRRLRRNTGPVKKKQRQERRRKDPGRSVSCASSAPLLSFRFVPHSAPSSSRCFGRATMAILAGSAGQNGLPMLSSFTTYNFMSFPEFHPTILGKCVAALAFALINNCPRLTRLRLYRCLYRDDSHSASQSTMMIEGMAVAAGRKQRLDFD